MPPLPPPPPPSRPMGAPPAPPSGSGGKKETEIVVIPEKFYGLALKQKVEPMQEPPKPAPAPVAPRPMAPPPLPAKRSRWPIVLVVLLLLLAVGGGFVYLNRDLLFKKPTPTPTPAPPAPPSSPIAPANLSASVSGTDNVALAWVDAATNETGYRLERREGSGTFLPLTNLPANSTAFLDGSAQPGKTYAYQVIAVNAGGDSSPSNEAPVTMPAALPPVTPAPTLPPGGLDSDSDGLSDLEEALYGTDPRVPDADKDGFLDGNEVFHLYNPGATAPIRLLDSGLVTLFTAPAGWSIYVPKAWSARLDQPDGAKATVDTKHGETIEIELLDNAQRLPLLDWYLSKNPGTLSSAVRTIITKSGLEGIQSPDLLTVYFAWDSKVFAIHYNIDGQVFINFRTTFEMILNSLKLNGAPVVATTPEVQSEGPGAILPTGSTSTAPAASSTAAETSTTTQP